ncbi:uncharacterized protein L203_102253 [Cryptococcus depauperatus CBS 7841]|uniref:Nuclear pore complex protein Nup205 n=1 Tax=Cryptococcus depauperatus CBS 7841 TaxID=1295531 RepID=A0AAJ8M0Z7_9TREE
MSNLPIADWNFNQFADLQYLLTRVLTQPTTTSLRKLYQQLEETKPWLLNLTLLPAPNEKDKQEIEKNPIELPNGTSIHIKGDLLDATNAVSSTLNLSQFLSAILALQSESQRAQYPSRSIPEISVYLLYRWQIDLLDFLHEIIRVTLISGEELGQHFEPLRVFVDDLLNCKVSIGLGKGDGTLIDQILSQLSHLSTQTETLMSSQCNGHEAYELLTFQLTALRTSQNKIASILCLVAEGGRLGRGQVIRTLKWLKGLNATKGQDGVVGLVMSGMMAAWKPLETIDASDPRYDIAEDWCHDIKFLKIASSLVLQDPWPSINLFQPLKLAWSAFYQSLLRHDPSVVQTGIDIHEIEGWLLDSINSGALHYLHDLVSSIRRERNWEEEDRETQLEEVGEVVKLATATNPQNDSFFFNQIRDLLCFLASKKQFLRNLRNKEEDSLTASRRASSLPQAQNQNYQAYLRLVGTVYKSLPEDEGLELWENSSFTSTVLDTRGGFPGRAFWSMLSAISRGPECSKLCYEKMKETRLPWTSLFKFYQHYIEIMPRLYESGPITSGRTPSMEPMPIDEVEVCIGWTNVLKTVVEGSEIARLGLAGSAGGAKGGALTTLWEFVNCDNVPLRLKASILNVITAFIQGPATSGLVDDDLLNQAVSAFEKITFRDPGTDCRYILESQRVIPPLGWLVKMSYIEDETGEYLLSRSYVEFLTALLPSISSDKSSGGRSLKLVNALRRGTFHILDGIIPSLKTRRYAVPNERWSVLATIITFFEKALLSFNIAELLSPVSPTLILQSKGKARTLIQVALELVEEPGFLVMLRILSDESIFGLLAEVLDNASSLGETRSKVAEDVLRGILRTFQRIHSIQLVFADVLLLALSDSSRNTIFSFRTPYGLQPLDNHLLRHLSNVNTIALLVGDSDAAVSYLAVKLVAALAQSPIFNRADVFKGVYNGAVNRLAGVLDASDDSIRISQGFSRRLDIEGNEVENFEKAEEVALQGNIDTIKDDLPMIIRSVILDILVDGTGPEVTTPNIAHFLLGYNFRHRDFVLQENDSCLHVVLKQMLEGADLSGPTNDGILEIHPQLGAKSAELMYQLFSHPLTGQTTLAFAMSVTGYSARQLASLQRRCPQWHPSTGLAITNFDEIPTTAEVLVAFLEFQRWIVSSSALEIFSYDGHGASASRIAQILFHGRAEEDEIEEELVHIPPLLVDLLMSVDIQWVEPPPESRQLEFYASFEFDAYKSPDIDWWDLTSLSAGLKTFRKSLERQGAITAASADAIEKEAEFILQKLGGKNRDTDVAIAKGNFLAAWNELLRVGLTMLFRHITEDEREVVLLDLLNALLARLDGDPAPGVMDIVCEAVLVTMTSLVNELREWEGVNLPMSQLSQVLEKIIDGATKPGSTETARGNLYAAVTQYLQLIVPVNIADDKSAVATSLNDITTPTLQRVTLNVISSKKDRLLTALCRDAMDDRDVWKTECFALLGGIVGLCQGDRDRHILNGLVTSGYLPLFVRSVKEKELALLECLSSEAENLHAYWVFEAKMAFLISLASSRKGSEDLLNCGLFEILATCGFINVQLNEEVVDEAVISEFWTRQHRVTICSLQLLARVLSNLHKGQRSGADHALSFFNAHRQAILAILSEGQQNFTPTTLEEIKLVVSIFAMIIHKVASEDLQSVTSFGAFHLAVLSVAAQSFDKSLWSESAEEDVRIEHAMLLLNQSLLTYLAAATKSLKASSGNPVFITGVQRSQANSVRYIASAPTLQMSVNYLADLVGNVEQISTIWESYLERQQDGGDLDAEELQRLDIAFTNDVPLTDDLIMNAFISKSQALFIMIETLLLLIWRHLLFYAGDVRSNLAYPQPVDLSNSLSLSMKGVDSSRLGNGKYDMEASKSGTGLLKVLERVATSLRSTLGILDDMETNLELQKMLLAFKGDAYYGMLLRRLKELIGGLVGENEFDEGNP